MRTYIYTHTHLLVSTKINSKCNLICLNFQIKYIRTAFACIRTNEYAFCLF